MAKKQIYLSIGLKIIVVIVLLYLFFNPKIFAIRGYDLAIDGVVICRGLSLLLGLNILSSLFEKQNK